MSAPPEPAPTPAPEPLAEPGAPDWDETPAEAAAWDRRWFGADHDRDEDGQ